MGKHKKLTDVTGLPFAHPNPQPRHITPEFLAARELEELRRLQQENRQLRQELKDAHFRIRELEESQRNLALFIPVTPSYYDEFDNYSVEVSLPSVTSSSSTIQMGSCEANQRLTRRQQQQQQPQQREQQQQQPQQPQQQQQQRDDRETYVGDDMSNHFSQARPGPIRRSFSRTASRNIQRITELRRLFSSTSDLSGSSTGSITAVCSSTSSSDMVGTRRSRNNNNNVSMYAMKSLLRVDSTDSDSSSTDRPLFAEI